MLAGLDSRGSNPMVGPIPRRGQLQGATYMLQQVSLCVHLSSPHMLPHVSQTCKHPSRDLRNVPVPSWITSSVLQSPRGHLHAQPTLAARPAVPLCPHWLSFPGCFIVAYACILQPLLLLRWCTHRLLGVHSGQAREYPWVCQGATAARVLCTGHMACVSGHPLRPQTCRSDHHMIQPLLGAQVAGKQIEAISRHRPRPDCERLLDGSDRLALAAAMRHLQVPGGLL